MERDPWERALCAVLHEGRDPEQIVVVDAFGSHLDLRRRDARAPKGERAIAIIPRTTPVTTTTIRSMTTAGRDPALIVDGDVTQRSFATSVAEVLGPTLQPGQMVLVATRSAHTRVRVQTIVAAQPCLLLLLPTSSPDYAPIELACANVKE